MVERCFGSSGESHLDGVNSCGRLLTYLIYFYSGDKGSQRDGMEGGHGKTEQPGRSLVQVVREGMGGKLDQSWNWLEYKNSKFENLRNGM